MSRITDYTQEVLSFQMEGGKESPSIHAPNRQSLDKLTERCLRIFNRSRRKTMVLFGIGSGLLAQKISARLGAENRLIVCELSLDRARQIMQEQPASYEILADSSPWAHLCMLGMEQITPDVATLVLNPELPPGPERGQLQSLQRLVSQAAQGLLPMNHLDTVSVSAGAILSPDEPELDQFFAQFPSWLEELCIVWDADEVPDMDLSCAFPVRQAAHPLDDFASQRNRMLALCSGEWILYLDGDESFSADGWHAIPALTTLNVESCYFTRQTLFPDDSHAKVGFGLWPDLQQRLFRNGKSVRFVRPVHEIIKGLDGPAAIALSHPIRHFSRLRKTPEQIRKKLARFDRTGAHDSLHRLNEDYPNIPCTALHPYDDARHVLILPVNPA